MNFIRQRLQLLTLLILFVECLAVVSMISILSPFWGESVGIARIVFGLVLMSLMFAVILWVFPMLMRSVWDMSDDRFWHVIVSLGGLVVPICLLLYDLHARFVLGRFYSGDRPIPYRLLKFSQPVSVLEAQKREKKPEQKRSHDQTPPEQSAEVSCPKCKARLLVFENDASQLNCYTCGSPLTVTWDLSGVTASPGPSRGEISEQPPQR